MKQQWTTRFATLLLAICTLTGSLFAQVNVGGVVKNSAGEPILGASVVLKSNYGVGTVTGLDGSYTITAKANDVLIFSYMGMATQEVNVANRTTIDVVLKEDAESLEEIVVVGYGVQRKSDLTGAVASINAEETLKKMPASQVGDMLQGRVAGLNIVNSSGAAGSAPTMRVRGVNSIKADGGPLVVIDGFPGGNLNSVSPSDIKSIEILKDASSTAIYGSRGANGVILITTKTPSDNKVSVDYNGYVNVGVASDLPEIMEVGEFANMANEWNRTFYKKTLYSQNQITNFVNGYDLFDYMGTIVNDYALSQSHDVSIKGSSEKMRYLFSAQYTHNEGIIGISQHDNLNYRLKIDSDLSKKVSIGANFSGRMYDSTTNGFSGSSSILTLAQEFPQTILPYETMKDENGNVMYDKNEQAILDYSKPTSGTISNSNMTNPMVFIDEQKRNNNLNQGFNNWIQAYLNWEVLPGLTFRNEQQLSISNSYVGTTSSELSYQGLLKGKSQATYSDTNSWGWRMTTTLNYTKEFNENHRINATIGAEQSLSNTLKLALSAEGMTSTQIGWKNLMLSELSKITEQSVSRSTAISYFGRVNYVLMNRYMVTATIRRDGSSLLAYQHRWDTFPSFSAAWNIKEESFMEDVEALDQLKLRYGYGVSGNQAVAAYSAFSTYNATIGSNGTVYSLEVGNPNLRWEKTSQHNLGLDLSLFGGRVTLNADYYDKTTANAINTVILPDDMGRSSGLRNAATINNKGFEATLGVIPVNTKDFFWKADLTLAHNEAVIVELGDIESDYMELGTGWGNAFYRYYEGQPIGSIYGLKSLGVWTTDDFYNPELEADKIFPKVRPGAYRYYDTDDNQIIDAEDYVIIGNGQPKFNWGLNNSLQWKNFDLNIFLIGYHGFDIYNYPAARLTSQLAPTPALADRWVQTTNEDAKIASFGPNRDAITSYEQVASSTFVEKGDFVKIKSITLGYNLTGDMLKKLGLSAARVYLSAKNLATFTGYSGNDPEMAISNPLRPGLDAGTYPAQTGFIFGVNLTF